MALPAATRRRLWLGACCATAFVSAVGSAQANRPVGWTISASSTDPFVNWAWPRWTPGPVDLYVWLACADWWIGVAAAEMGIGGTLQPVEFRPVGGWLSASTPTELVIAKFGCPNSPMLAGILTVHDPGGGGTLYFVPSSNNRILTVACGGMGYLPDWIGFASDGSWPLYDISFGDVTCMLPSSGPPTAAGGEVQAHSWGRVKALYR